MTCKLWLDDIRDPPDGSWTWVQTVEAAAEVFSSTVVGEASLDNDLGEGIPEGRDLVRWLEREALWPSRRIAVHSANGPASTWMSQQIESLGAFFAEPGRPRSFVRPDDAFASFATTRITVRPPESPEIVLVPGAVPAAPPLPLPFTVITAHNPLSRSRDAEANRLAHERLRRATAAASAVIPASGSAPDGQHSEESLAISGLSLDDALDLGCSFGQRAIFWIDEDAVTIRDCTPVRYMAPRAIALDLRRYSDDVEGALAMRRVLEAVRSGELLRDEATGPLRQHASSVECTWLVDLVLAEELELELLP